MNLPSLNNLHQFCFSYALENLKFGKIDIGRYPEAAITYKVDVSTRSKQLPTVILFQKGKEVTRRPSVSHTGQIIRFFFAEVYHVWGGFVFFYFLWYH